MQVTECNDGIHEFAFQAIIWEDDLGNMNRLGCWINDFAFNTGATLPATGVTNGIRTNTPPDTIQIEVKVPPCVALGYRQTC
jgi:hypothetical protein